MIVLTADQKGTTSGRINDALLSVMLPLYDSQSGDGGRNVRTWHLNELVIALLVRRTRSFESLIIYIINRWLCL